MVALDTELTAVLGAKTAKNLADAFGMTIVEDLLRHYPRRYEKRGALTELRSLNIGDHVTLQAEVVSYDHRKNATRPGSRQEAVITDGTGKLTLVWFNQQWREKDLKPGRKGLFSGQVSVFNNKRQLTHPEYDLLADDDVIDASKYVDQYIPVYAATAKVQSWTIARSVDLVLAQLDAPADPLPESIRIKNGLLDLADALRLIHKPESDESLEAARIRLKWDEALALQVVLAQQRHEEASWPAIPRTEKAGGLLEAFDARLPFTLTQGQKDVAATIAHELAEGHPMHRLLQGEVGSGKTVLALRAMLTVVDSGGQAALLAPTEVLAAQHYRAICNLLGPLAERGKLGSHDEGTGVTLLTGSLNTATKKQALLDITTGQAGIVIGTHALIQERVDFFDLGLVVIDEQHRFGVEQRATLVAKAGSDRRPHVLVMTATPIPRTVAMTAFGALDISTLTELPGGRSPITTHVVNPAEQPGHLIRAWSRAVEEVGKGHQVYVVVPRIESSENGTSVEDLVPQLEEGPLASVRVGMMHGGLAPADKDDIMRRFAQDPTAPDGIDVLVSTTVIEVGVDVPNATMMIIMDAERFGISQLHQLRGRVGRGTAPGLCLLVSEAPAFSSARERLDAVASTTDGFRLAELDLEQRREGDVLGREQSGIRSSLHLVSILDDVELLEQAREQAEEIIVDDPELEKHPALKQAVSALVNNERAEYVKKS